MKQFVITKQNEGQRFDKYLFRILDKGSMSFIFKMLRKKNFVLNDKKATGKEILKSGDIIKLYISDDTFEKFQTNAEVLDASINDNKKLFVLQEKIVYEDKDIILINKPKNVLSQKAKKDDVSLNEYIIDYLVSSKWLALDDLKNFKPSCVNRLDRNTTGIIICAKSLKAAQYLSDSLKNRSVKKYYKCIVKGTFNKEGTYKGYLTKDNNNKVHISEQKTNENSNYIETEYKLLRVEDDLSTVEVHLITGKSHQIRAHIAYLGFPIVGDNKYGDLECNRNYKVNNQMLHAYKIEFPIYDAKLEFAFSGKTYICEPEFNL